MLFRSNLINSQNFAFVQQIFQGMNPNQPGIQALNPGIQNPILNQNIPNPNISNQNLNAQNFANLMNNPNLLSNLQSLGGMNPTIPNKTNPPSEAKIEVPKVQLRDQYATQLQQLNDMGFADEGLNIDLLQSTNGNVSDVANILSSNK